MDDHIGQAFEAAKDYIRELGYELVPRTEGHTSYKGHQLYKYMYILPGKGSKEYLQVKLKSYPRSISRSFALDPPLDQERNSPYPIRPDDTSNSETTKEAFKAARAYITESGFPLIPKRDGYYTSYKGHTLYKGMGISYDKGYTSLTVSLAGLPHRSFRLNRPSQSLVAARNIPYPIHPGDTSHSETTKEAFKDAEAYITGSGFPLIPKSDGYTSYKGHTLYKGMSISYDKGYTYLKVAHAGLPYRSFKLNRPSQSLVAAAAQTELGRRRRKMATPVRSANS